MPQRLFLAIAIAVLSTPALAQRTLVFNPQTTTGDGQVTPVLTWSTTPPADSCEASGQWAGEKGPSGTESLPPIDMDATYNLRCFWQGDSLAEVTWTNATTNLNGTNYTDPATTRIAYAFDRELTTEDFELCNTPTCVEVPHSQTMRTFTNITEVGELRVAAVHVNQRGVMSPLSNTATKVFTGIISSEESVGITVNPIPSAPGGVDVN